MKLLTPGPPLKPFYTIIQFIPHRIILLRLLKAKSTTQQRRDIQRVTQLNPCFMYSLYYY